TRSVLLTGTTNEAATCRFDTTDVAYGSMAYAFGNIDVTTFAANYFAAEGSNTLYVRCKDTAGNVMTSSTQITFTVDSVAPYVTAATPQGGYYTSPATISVTTNEDSTCKYDTQDIAYGSMANIMTEGAGNVHTATPTPASDGLIHYYIRCKDDSQNNEMTSSVLVYYIYDSTNPSTPSLISPSSGSRLNSAPTLVWSESTDLNGVSYYVLELDKETDGIFETTYNVYTTSYTLTGAYWSSIPEGATAAWKVKAVDYSGRSSAYSTVFFFTKDTTAPTFTSTTGTSFNTRSVLLTGTTNEAATCRFDTTDVAYGSMAYAFGNLDVTTFAANYFAAEGSNTLYVRCKDTAGNVMTSSTQITFIVDSTAPLITASSPQGGYKTAVPVTLSVTTNEAATCKYDTQDREYGSMANTFSTTGGTTHTTGVSPSDGTYHYYVRCQDSYGNVMLASTVLYFTLDTVVPTYSIVSVDPSIAKQGTEVTVTFLASEELKAAINPTVTIGGLSATLYARDGKYFVYKRTLTGSEANGEIVISGGEDLAGNTATQLTNSLLLMVDFVAPTITGTAPTGTLNTGSVTLMVNTSENAICKFSEFNVGYDTMDMMAGSGTEHVKTLYGLPSGGYTFYFRCRDTAGNEGNLATTTFTIDRTAPTILDAEPEEGIYTTIPQLRILVDENAVCRWANHTGTFANMPSSNEFTVNANVWKTITEGTPTASYIEDAENKFWVICKDNYGNEMTQPIVIAFLLNAQDNEAPYIVSSAPNGTINDSTPTLMVVTNENANCQYSTREFDYGSGTAFTTTGGTTHTVTLSELADGQYAYYVRCQDTSGNKMTQSTVIIFTIDTRDRCFYYKDLVTPWTAHFDLPPDMNGSALYNLALDPTKNTYRVVDVLNSSLGNNLASVWWYNTTRNSWMVYFHNIDPNTKLGLINLGIWIETMRNTGEQYWIRIYTPPARVCIPKQ
ncbi:MAG: Ig-like domain-containing protein, partial [Candidatus Altiarchaeota archaeon]